MVQSKAFAIWVVSRPKVSKAPSDHLIVANLCADWIKNKQSSQFVFEGICWAKSFIPRDIWEAGDSNSNVVEIVHQDVNREGLHCTLLGAHTKAQSFDTVKMNTLRVC